MILLLQNTNDRPATWLHQQLAARSVYVVQVTVDEILTSKQFSLQMTEGQYRSAITLQRGLVIESEKVQAVINRIQYLPALFESTFKKQDAEYVNQEWYAMLLSWLHSLQPKVLFNEAAPTGMAGERYNNQEWMMMAAKAGFSVLPYWHDHRQGETIDAAPVEEARIQSLIAYDGAIFPASPHEPLPASLTAPVHDLQRQAGAQLLGLQLLVTPNDTYFISATTFPILSEGGEALVSRIRQTIQQKQTITHPVS